MLTMCRLADTAKAVALYDTLITFSFRSGYYVNKRGIVKQLYIHHIAQVELCFKVFELSQVPFGGYAGLCKMSHQGFRGMLFLLILKTELNSCITVLFNRLQLSNHTRTCFDNSAWNIFSLGTEYGNHSDFLS